MHVVQCTDAAARAGAEVSRSVRETTSPVLLLLSGGSSLNILDYIPEDIFSSRVTISVLDERVSRDPGVNNFLQITAHPIIRQAIARGSQVIDTTAFSGETPQQMAVRFEHALRDWNSQNPDGKKVATVGMGSDGHTFGMIPYPEDSAVFDRMFVHTPQWVTGYDTGSKNRYPLRVTTTIPLARLISASIWYVCGQDKAAMLARALDRKTPVHVVPARIILDMNEVTLFTDCLRAK